MVFEMLAPLHANIARIRPQRTKIGLQHFKLCYIHHMIIWKGETFMKEHHFLAHKSIDIFSKTTKRSLNRGNGIILLYIFI